ncbi:TF29 [Hepatospora eriocheir]|uniref:TF29 n=1 Tax=Hepatospora eriocheir TaxID=1081669 RepID=A0A1X0QKL0_9MICR|nr:TF29 [Hepatospora eriocheir]
MFVSGISMLTASLNKKLKDKRHFKWKSEDEEQKSKILKATENFTELKHVDHDNKFILETDASEEGITGVLRQNHIVVGIFSRKLDGFEINYSIPEKLLCAVLKSM